MSANLAPHYWLVCVAVLWSAPLVGVAQQQRVAANNAAQTQARDSAPRYEVQPGDLLHVSVWKEADLDQDVLVRPDGGFSFPLAGDVRAAGKTVEELRNEITERLARFIPDLFVTVAVREINGNKIYVIGKVNNPGQFVVNPRVDVMQALTLAGGGTEFADMNNIFVLRRELDRQRTLPFDFNDVVNGRRLEQNVLLQSGDVVVVP
jgi:polysaccharide export outer membrane protein